MPVQRERRQHLRAAPRRPAAVQARSCASVASRPRREPLRRATASSARTIMPLRRCRPAAGDCRRARASCRRSRPAAAGAAGAEGGPEPAPTRDRDAATPPPGATTPSPEASSERYSRVRDGLGVARGRGDHRGVVGAERERRERGVGQRGAELRVGGDAADDGDPVRPPAASTRSTSARTIARW